MRSLEQTITAQSIKTPPRLPRTTADPRPPAGRAESVTDILRNLQAKLAAPQSAAPTRVRDGGVQTEPIRMQGAAAGPEDEGTWPADHCPAPARLTRAQLGGVDLGTDSEGTAAATTQPHPTRAQPAREPPSGKGARGSLVGRNLRRATLLQELGSLGSEQGHSCVKMLWSQQVWRKDLALCGARGSDGRE